MLEPFSITRDFPFSIPSELSDPKYPIKKALQLNDGAQKVNGSAILQKIPPAAGSGHFESGRIKFVQFQADEKQTWYAVKRPLYDHDPHRYLQIYMKYKRAASISKELGNHPNFMKIHASLYRDKDKGEQPYLKPYLICEYLEGHLYEGYGSEEIFNQIRDSLLYLFDKKIYPSDCANNIMLLNDGRAVFIDFDEWAIVGSRLSDAQLAAHLYTTALKIVNYQRLLPTKKYDSTSDIRKQLENDLDALISLKCGKSSI